MDLRQNAWRPAAVGYGPLLIWIGVIFFLSSGQGSMSQTSLFIRPLLEFLFPNTPEETLLAYHGYIRKFAHFYEYGVLGLFASRAFASSGKRPLRNSFFALALVLVTAAVDELNQSFNPARTGSVLDVLLNLSGGVAGTFIWWLVVKRNYRD